MGAVQRLLRAFGYDAIAVDMPVTGVVVVLDVGEVDGLGNPRPLVQLS